MCDFDAAVMVNGVFYEKTDRLLISETDVLYVTCLPLNHKLLPYTVKLCAMSALFDTLARGYRLNSELYCLKLKPRYIYIYDTTLPPLPTSNTLAAKLFNAVKSGNINEGMNLLSDDLKRTLTPTALTAFFDGYCDIIPHAHKGDLFFLVSETGACDLFEFKTDNSLITDIDEKPQ